MLHKLNQTFLTEFLLEVDEPRPKLQPQWRILEPPTRHINELQRVILAEQLIVAQDINLPIFLDAIQHLLRDKLFKLCDSRLWAASNKSPLQILQIRASAAFETEIDLLVHSVIVWLFEFFLQLCLEILAVFRVLRQYVFRTWKIAGFVEVSFTLHLV